MRKVPQASTGFSPFELLCRQQPRDILDLLPDTWFQQAEDLKEPTLFIRDLQEKLQQVSCLAQEVLGQAQVRQKERYDRQAKVQEFS